MKTALHITIWLLVLAAAATGVFYRTSEPHVQMTTVRDEQATYQGSGLYRYDPASVAREGIVWDSVNLLIGLPLLALGIHLRRRGSLRGRLLLAGLFFYFFYNYLMYATMTAFNPFFLVYVAIFALSSVAFLVNLGEIDVAGLPAAVTPHFPRRTFIAYSLGMGVMIALLWLRLTVSIMAAGRFPAEIAGMNTLQTQAMDLGMIVPLTISAGLLLWRRRPWGYMLAAIVASFGLMMCIVLPAWIAVPLIQDGRIDLVEAVPFLAGCALGLTLAIWLARSIREVGT
ncbi:MAG TPA: hypothetical protein VHI13_09245 [Candidatus Kapabacteria bacterium]|nr:hypothetical protein [Candidatus Kapabacteria bacterium]